MSKPLLTGLSIIVILFLVSPSAYARHRLTKYSVLLFGGANLTQPQYVLDPPASKAKATGQIGLAGGFAVEIPISKRWSVDTGLTLLQRKYDLEYEHTMRLRKSSNLANFLQFPLMLRVRLFGEVSLGAGVAGGRYLNTELSGMRSMDYGLVGGLRVSHYLKRRFSLEFDLRYSHGLNDAAVTTDQKLNFNDAVVLAGLGFHF